MKLLQLASNRSFWSGIDYYHDKNVVRYKKTSDIEYVGEVRGSKNNVYHVSINVRNPKKSTYSCPFAEGRRVICKHMVALYLDAFPEKEQEMMDYIEEQNQLYELEVKKEKMQREQEIRQYVMSLPKAKLQEMLIEMLLYDGDRGYY